MSIQTVKDRQKADAAADAWLWFTLPIAIIATIASGMGLLVAGLYRDPSAWALQGKAQDATDLMVVVPVLVISALLARHGSWRARLVWLGTLTYLVYAFAIYAFSIQHNALFLFYVAVLGCSLWALIGGMVKTNWQTMQSQGSASRSAMMVVSFFLILLAVLFALLWLADEIPALLRGEIPASIQGMGVPTNPIHVLDFTMLLPTMVIAAILLWRQRMVGYGLAAMMLVHTIFQALGIAAVMFFSLEAGLAGSFGVALGFMALAAVTLALLGWHLGLFNARTKQRAASSPSV